MIGQGSVPMGRDLKALQGKAHACLPLRSWFRHAIDSTLAGGETKVNRYRLAFPHRHVILPVIHVVDEDQALRNANIAREAGCKGVFLINHGPSYRRLLEIHSAVRREFPGWWMGVNCLDLSPREVFSTIGREVSGVWVDNALVDERREDQSEAERIQAARMANGWQGLYFGGVAFKYQRHVDDLARAAQLAIRFMDVVTTSGPGTGQAAPRQKILALRQSLGTHPLAIASGITPNNVGDYLGIADCFLVATGISKSFTELDSSLVRQLVGAVEGFEPESPPDVPGATPQPIKGIRSVCFVCEWNEGRSAHLELSTRRLLKARGSQIGVSSAGLRQGRGINSLRREFLADLGVPPDEIGAHWSTVFGPAHAGADLILVAELPMKERLLAAWPQLQGRVMTVRGFVSGCTPHDDFLTESEAHIEDAGGHNADKKLALYAELENLSEQVAIRLLSI